MTTKKKSKKTAGKVKAYRSRDVLIQRERPHEPKPTIPLVSQQENLMMIKVFINYHSGRNEGEDVTVPSRGVWSEFKFSTYARAAQEAVDPGLTSKIKELEDLYCHCCQYNDWTGLTEAALELVVLAGSGGSWTFAQYRYDKMLFVDFQFPEYHHRLSAKCLGFLEEMLQNPNEMPFFQALAVHLLARSSRYDAYYDEDDRNQREALLALLYELNERCKAVSGQCREIAIQRHQKETTIGDLLDQMAEVWNDMPFYLEYDHRGDAEKEELEKLEKRREKVDLEEVFPSPPTLNRDTLKSVAELPEVEKYFLVAKRELTLNERFEWKWGSRSNKDNWAKLENGDKYAVFEVNYERYVAGKRQGVFKQVQVCLLNRDDALPKKVLAPLVLACLQPYQNVMPDSSPKATQDLLPARPKKVLFESAEVTSHPQVKLFLSMMGCTDIGVDEGMVQLLTDTQDAVMAPSKKEFPHLYYEAKGVKCGGCDKRGGSLFACPCKKAHYCSKECQEAQWPAHKTVHKQTMAKKKAKKEGKESSNK